MNENDLNRYLWTYDLNDAEIKAVIDNWRELIDDNEETGKRICKLASMIGKNNRKKEKTKEKNKKAFARQIYIYKKLKENENNYEAIKELIQLTSEEIKTQYTRKGLIENRAGFLLALWGVAAIIACDKIPVISNPLLGVISIVLGLISLILICTVIKGDRTSMYSFGSVENNYLSAVDDRAAFNVRLLEGITNAQIANNKIISMKYKCAFWAVVSTAVYITVLITMACLGVK